MVNHAQDLMSAKKFLDLPNKLIPSDQPVSDVDTDQERINIINIPLAMIQLGPAPECWRHLSLRCSGLQRLLSFFINTIFFKEVNH